MCIPFPFMYILAGIPSVARDTMIISLATPGMPASLIYIYSKFVELFGMILGRWGGHRDLGGGGGGHIPDPPYLSMYETLHMSHYFVSSI